ncbi:hypothetical protein CFP56_033914 [Quercus suber]|uniref:Uncharacterized protein n=1 Tax=Quercus suber TaxID=58331 RepID=A0AAW0JE75_QUESU
MIPRYLSLQSEEFSVSGFLTGADKMLHSDKIFKASATEVSANISITAIRNICFISLHSNCMNPFSRENWLGTSGNDETRMLANAAVKVSCIDCAMIKRRAGSGTNQNYTSFQPKVKTEPQTQLFCSATTTVSQSVEGFSLAQ